MIWALDQLQLQLAVYYYKIQGFVVWGLGSAGFMVSQVFTSTSIVERGVLSTVEMKDLQLHKVLSEISHRK